MDYNLALKVDGKWHRFGGLGKNKFGNNQVSFTLKDLKELVTTLEKNGKNWADLAVFEKHYNNEHSIAKGNAYVKEEEVKPAVYDWEGDEIPF